MGPLKLIDPVGAGRNSARASAKSPAMTLKIKRSSGEEQTFESGDAVWDEVRAGRLSIEDDVLVSGSQNWIKIAELPGSEPIRRKRIGYWYVFAGVIALTGLLFRSLLITAGVFLLGLMWRVYVQKKEIRFW